MRRRRSAKTKVTNVTKVTKANRAWRPAGVASGPPVRVEADFVISH